jgi:tetratricopeptide (TPR) repeat protein
MHADDAYTNVPPTPSMSRDEWGRVKRVASEAIELPAADRDSYVAAACGRDEALREQVSSLLESMDQVGEQFETPALALPEGRSAAAEALRTPQPLPAGGRIGPWRILRELGHGGMGTVYLAERVSPEFRQQAALKIVRGGFADDMLLRRFQDERRILATLDHPHIARLIDGGATELGLPYVIMEYVEGRPIDVFCDERALDVRQRLAVFRLVCLAVHYAHQRLVVHRDLKASNILVTAEGTPKLLDFGIAKIIETDREIGDTRTLFRVLTPESASPEQVRGGPITTATDVYALGVLLYRLLTGSLPYRLSSGSGNELIQAICEQPPEAPSAAPRTAPGVGAKHPIDRDLDRIVLMALRKEPERRYGTAEQLAEDVRRYLAGLPIVAAPDSALYRTRKFVSRNRVAVAAGLAVLVAIAGGIVATTWQARLARQERNRAQQHFEAVRSLAGSVLGELHDAVATLPGSLAARELLVRRATEYLDALSANVDQDAGLRRELALGYSRLAQVQGQAGLPNLGDQASARRSYERAETLYESLDARTLDATAGAGLIETYVALAQSDSNRETQAARHARAQSLADRFLREAPSDPRILGAATVVWSATGNAQERAKDYAGALQSFTKVMRAAEATLALTPENASASRNLSLAYKKVGTEHELLGAPDEAIAFYTKAMALDRARADREPGRGLWRLDLSFAHGAIATALSKKGELQGSLGHHLQAIELRRTVVAGDPDDDFAQLALARGYERVAFVRGRLGDVDGVIGSQSDRVSVYARRRAAHPERDNVWRDQAAAAMDAVEKCLDLLEHQRVSDQRAQARRVRSMLDGITQLQAQWTRDKRSGPLPPARADLERAIERCERLIRR